VDEGEALEQLEGGAGVDHHGVVGIAARGPEPPVAERRTEALAPAEHQSLQGLEGFGEGGIERGPAHPLFVEEAGDAGLDPFGDHRQIRRQQPGGAAVGRGRVCAGRRRQACHDRKPYG
jgi:hypothetical protein